MAKVQNFSGISPDLPFTEFDFYELYRQTFATSELGKIRKRLPLREMAENFGLISKSMRAKKGRKTYFTPEGKVALMFLKMYTGLSSPKLMEHLNGNVHYQLFCDVRIDPMHPLTNYKLLDDVFSELARGLKIQQQQEILARAWKPYMKDLDTMYTDATCYESRSDILFLQILITSSSVSCACCSIAPTASNMLERLRLAVPLHDLPASGRRLQIRSAH